MRIIRGEYKGIRIKPPKSFKARPTTDFAKEALFSILENRFDFEEIRFLDLFSGTGSISYEFASRGCKDITSVEIDGKNVNYIIKTKIDVFKRAQKFNVVQADVFRFIKKGILNYDIIFADPPYENPNINSLPDLIFANTTIKENTLVIIEHSRTNDFTNHPYLERTRHYGKVNFSFFSRQKDVIKNEEENTIEEETKKNTNSI